GAKIEPGQVVVDREVDGGCHTVDPRGDFDEYVVCVVEVLRVFEPTLAGQRDRRTHRVPRPVLLANRTSKARYRRSELEKRHYGSRRSAYFARQELSAPDT